MKLQVKHIVATDKYIASFTGRHWFKWVKRWTPKNVTIQEVPAVVSAPAPTPEPEDNTPEEGE